MALAIDILATIVAWGLLLTPVVWVWGRIRRRRLNGTKRV